MAAFCRYWRMTPSEYRSLRLDEHAAMTQFMVEELQRR